MNTIELLQLVGIALVVLSVLILLGTYVAIRINRSTANVKRWVAEQEQEAREYEARKELRRSTLPVRSVAPARPVSISPDDTRPIERLACPRELTTLPCKLYAGHGGACEVDLPEPPPPPACGDTYDHPAHYFITYVETGDAAAPDMAKRPCAGVRSGPHRRRA